MMRRRIRPAGSTRTTSGSARVRSLARKASYSTSFRSIRMAPGPDIAIPGMGIPAMAGGVMFAIPAVPDGGASPTPWCREPPSACCAMACGGLRTGAGEAGEHLVRRPEGEIVQHDDDFLAILALRRLVLDDQRRGHQALFLHAVMRMHPVGAGDRRVVVGLDRAIRRSAGFGARGNRPASKAEAVRASGQEYARRFRSRGRRGTARRRQGGCQDVRPGRSARRRGPAGRSPPARAFRRRGVAVRAMRRGPRQAAGQRRALCRASRGGKLCGSWPPVFPCGCGGWFDGGYLRGEPVLAVTGPIDNHGGGLLRRAGAVDMGMARRRRMPVRLMASAAWRSQDDDGSDTAPSERRSQCGAESSNPAVRSHTARASRPASAAAG